MSIIEYIIALFAPHNCLNCGAEGHHLCRNCAQSLPEADTKCYHCHIVTPNGVCGGCSERRGLQRVIYATPYRDVAKDILWQLKFNRSKAAARDIAQALHYRTPALPTGAVVCFVPTAHTRVRQRGYDQAALIAREFARLRNLPFVPMLTRMGSHRQVGASAIERQTSMADAFRIKGQNVPRAATVIIVDDVITTGSSMEAAARVLRQAGASRVWALAFARAE